MANTLLLTYFGPFPGVPVNPTVALAEGAVRALNTARPDLRVVARELPVSYDGSSAALRAALQEVQPDALISLGVAVGRDVVSLEQVAINLDSAGIEDNDGDRRCDEPIVPDGREAYFSSLPVRASFERLRAAGEPVEISYTAGTYVCNHVFYEGQRITRELGLSIPAGFVHVPAICADGEEDADGEEATEGVELTAHRDAGGVVRDEQGIPQLPESTVVRIIAEIASDTLPAVD
ncbi:MAG: pyroglutamyl-peptidase I [Rothia sp.]|uniref:pyroglutamyl-peptidase I family protein n=1 Tax=Rothia sp. (in: high G+C Gram-positive bacteria) TaxID=1885016 RepID=UPI001CB37521|nr:pyroglutamyl-peptidase I [Rothia sp. (in: high G+C Gram-positive bacteria)]MBF1676841.1 pyroglutamyl-peptidase I [Rothia sp. (in: high G+C Gram-positive bacteria)]